MIRQEQKENMNLGICMSEIGILMGAWCAGTTSFSCLSLSDDDCLVATFKSGINWEILQMTDFVFGMETYFSS